MDDRLIPRLAIVIGEWSAAIAHLDAVETAGWVVPIGVRARVDLELHRACAEWWHRVKGYEVYSDVANRAEAIANARAWATANQSLIDEVTNQKGTAHGPTQGA